MSRVDEYCPYDEQNKLRPIILFLGNEPDWEFWNYTNRQNEHGLVQLTNNHFSSGIRGLLVNPYFMLLLLKIRGH